MQLHNLKSALRQKRIPNHLENKSLSVILVKNPLMLRLGQGPICSSSPHTLAPCVHATKWDIYAVAICLNAAPPDCHNPRCHAMLANTAMRVYFETLWLNWHLGWRFILEKHPLLVPWPFYWKTKSICFCSQPQYTMTSVPVARQSISVSARVWLLVKDASSASYVAPNTILCTGGPSMHSPALLAYGASFGQVGHTRRRALHPRFQTMRTQHGTRASISPPKSPINMFMWNTE